MAGSLERRTTPPTGIEPSVALNRLNPHDFLGFLRERVSIEMLLADRHGQARLDKELNDKFTRKPNDLYIIYNEEFHRDRPKNNYPYLHLTNKSGNIGSFVYQPFMLRDQQFYYYFHTGWPVTDVPPYLREQDVVPSGRYKGTYPEDLRRQAMQDLGITEEMFWDLVYNVRPEIRPYTKIEEIPFNKPINRVSTMGGKAERYNYHTNEWEKNGDMWRPGLRRRTIEIAKRVIRRSQISADSDSPAITQ